MSGESFKKGLNYEYTPVVEEDVIEVEDNSLEAVASFRERENKFHAMLAKAQSLEQIQTIVESFSVPLTVGGRTEESVWGEDSIHASVDNIAHEMRRKESGYNGGINLDDPSIAGGLPGKALNEAVNRVLSSKPPEQAS